jgi:Zn-dependent peptidase ImmA (M78 family)
LKSHMSTQPLLSDRQLREQIMSLVQRVRNELPGDATSADIQRVYKLQIRDEHLPLDKDGAFIESERKIIINRKVTSVERRLFTLYHELVHYLLREDEDLYSYLHDAYVESETFDKTIELLCNIGAAEFVIPRERVRELIDASEFSLNLVPTLCEQKSVSGPAALIQLIQCAAHRCYGVVCEVGISPLQIYPNQTALFHTNPESSLFIRYAIWSPTTKYSLARWTVIPRGHILAKATDDRAFVLGIDRIPFRSGKEWRVPCEALFFRNSVYGLFNVTPPSSHQQLRLF